MLLLDQLLVNSVGEAASANVSLQFHSVNGDSICRVHVKPSAHPVEATVRVLDKGGQLQKKTAFYIRLNHGTREVTSEAEKQKYIAQRWKA